MENFYKPYLNIRVNNLTVDGILTYDGTEVISSPFTPTLSPVSGVSGVTGQYSYYTQVENVVTVFSCFQYTENNGGQPMISSSLPIPRSISGNFGNIAAAIGSGNANASSVPIIEAGVVTGILTTQNVLFTFNASPSPTTHTLLASVTYSYTI
jgi:hypothetical protein